MLHTLGTIANSIFMTWLYNKSQCPGGRDRLARGNQLLSAGPIE
jgi:hypothetical protein